MLPFLFTAGISYLLGSIPFGYILVRTFRDQDIRTSGSGNIGATNVARSSPALGMLTLVLDAGKGFLAVYLAIFILNRTSLGYYDARLYSMMSLATLSAIIGHMFPVWLNFHGGKGVAAAFGGFLLFAPRAILGAVIVFLLIILITRYVSLASIIATAIFPLFAWLFYRRYFSPGGIVIVSIASFLVILRHHQNIGRLFAGTEPRFQLRRG